MRDVNARMERNKKIAFFYFLMFCVINHLEIKITISLFRALPCIDERPHDGESAKIYRFDPQSPKRTLSGHVGLQLPSSYFSNKQLSAVDETTILNPLKIINPPKAPGLDKIAGKFLKESAVVLARPSTKIYKFSIPSSIFPDKCKHAKLKPIIKKGPTTEAKTYRPISYCLSFPKSLRK